MTIERALLCVAAIAAAACTDARQSPSASSTTSAPADSAIWLTRERTLDFTGDGLPDTVRLRALGRSADSLRIELTFRSGGAVRWREEWASDYELAVAPPLADDAARDSFVRGRLDRALASVEVEPFDPAAYATMADPVDSAILRRPPHEQVSFAYGYETTVVLAWDPASARLERLHACC
jgi:hypothetical protein